MKIPTWYKRSIYEAIVEISSEAWEFGDTIPKVQLEIWQWQSLVKETAKLMGNYLDGRTKAGKWYKSQKAYPEIQSNMICETDFGTVEVEVI